MRRMLYLLSAIRLVALFLMSSSLFAQHGYLMPTTAEGLINFLTYKIDRPHRDNHQMGIHTCGEVVANRDAAILLARFGKAALPPVEKEIERIVAAPHISTGWSWLTGVYAATGGRNTAGYLLKLNNRLSGTLGLDPAIATSLAGC